MCGIAGIIAPAAERYHEQLNAMIAALHHRGPDANGAYFFPNCGLGHTRLSIVDLSGGQQPMISADCPIGVTFNGEIYGYKELRADCHAYPFQSTSDTEVILALYARDGRDFVQKLPGMFAFALWDERRQALICARDRFGEKPFYYAIGQQGEFVFASEIKAILASGLVEPVLSKTALAFYLQHLYVHPYTTIYRNIHVLPPAHMLCYCNGALMIERYWELPVQNDRIGLLEAQAEFQRLLDRAVAKQLVADVPVGAFLSGGLDSSTIVAYASRHQARVKTFSFAFKDGNNELPYAREVAKRYRTEHTELSDIDANLGELLLTMQSVYDEPFADSSNIPTYLIAKLARQHIKVVLTGDGGDELLAGYHFWYQPLRTMQHMHFGSQFFYGVLARAVKFSPRIKPYLPPSVHYGLEGLALRRQYATIAAAHRAHQQRFSPEALGRLGLQPSVNEGLGLARYASNTVDDAMRMDIEEYMAGDILVKIDRASMAHGLELRAPFLDVDFATFCISLPARLKITHDTEKYILRKACAHLWPAAVQQRTKKGFGAPVAAWLRQESVKCLVHEYLYNPGRKIYDVLAYEECRRLIAQNNYQSWALLVLALWLEKHQVAITE